MPSNQVDNTLLDSQEFVLGSALELDKRFSRQPELGNEGVLRVGVELGENSERRVNEKDRVTSRTHVLPSEQLGDNGDALTKRSRELEHPFQRSLRVYPKNGSQVG